MNGITKFSIPALAVLMLAACGSDNDDPDPVVDIPTPPPQSTYVRVHHSVADAPDVNVLVDGTVTLEGVPFGASSGVLELDEGSYSLQVDGILADGSTATVIGPADVTLGDNLRYEVFAVGKVGEGSIEPLIFANQDTDVTAGNARVEVVHAAPDAPLVDIFVTAPGADLSAEAALTTLAYKDNSGQVEVTADDYQIRITVAGEPANVVFDSGTITLPDGADLVVAAVANTMTGSSPVMLQIADGESATLLADVNAGADIRVVHASADAPAVDVAINNGDPAITNLAFTEATGTKTAAIGPVSLTLEGGGIYTAAAVDADGGGLPPGLILLDDLAPAGE